MKKVANNSSEAVETNHTTYIKFDYHNNHFMLAAMDAVQTVFRNYLFDVAMSWYSNSPIEDDDNFNTRWEKFDDFIRRYYGGDANNFAHRLATLIVVSNYIYHNLLYNDYCNMTLSKYENKNGKIIDNESIVKETKDYLIPKTKVECDISFVNDIDLENDWDASTLYLDMATGLIYKC